MTKIRIVESARADLEDAFRFYELQEQGLGEYFKSCLNNDIDGLRITAGIHRKTNADYHRLLSRVFPYAIYYTYSDGCAEIWAIIDCRRNPEWIRKYLD